MAQKDELFMLIHSMDKNEKGYFKKFAGISGQKDSNIYTRLFDCIGRMKAYDIQQIEMEFKNEKVLKHLSVTKFYLKIMIIRALRNYYEEQIPYINNLTALADTYIMLKKGLYKSALKRILKEKESSLNEQSSQKSMQWMFLQDVLILQSGMMDEQYKTGKAIYAQKEMVASQYANYAGYFYLKSQIIPSLILKDKSRINEVKKLFNHPLLSSPEMALSHFAKELYYELRIRIHQFKDEPDKAGKVIRESIEYNEKNNIWKSNPHTHFQALNELLNSMGSKEQAHNMAPIIAKCRKLVSENTDSLNSEYQTIIKTYTYLQEMRMYLLLDKPEVTLRSGQQLEKFIKTITYVKDEEMGLLLLQAVAYVALKQFDKALDRLNQIFISGFKERNDIMADVYLLNIIVHIELGNHAIIKRQLNLAKNFIKNTEIDPQWYLSLITQFEKLATAIRADNKKAIQKSVEAVQKIVNFKKWDRKVFINDWLEAKFI